MTLCEIYRKLQKNVSRKVQKLTKIRHLLRYCVKIYEYILTYCRNIWEWNTHILVKLKTCSLHCSYTRDLKNCSYIYSRFVRNLYYYSILFAIQHNINHCRNNIIYKILYNNNSLLITIWKKNQPTLLNTACVLPHLQESWFHEQHNINNYFLLLS